MPDALSDKILSPPAVRHRIGAPVANYIEAAARRCIAAAADSFAAAVAGMSRAAAPEDTAALEHTAVAPAGTAVVPVDRDQPNSRDTAVSTANSWARMSAGAPRSQRFD